MHDSECESGWIQSPSKSIDLIYDLVISLPFNLKKKYIYIKLVCQLRDQIFFNDISYVCLSTRIYSRYQNAIHFYPR